MTVLKTEIEGRCCFCRTTRGDVLIATGEEPAMRWGASDTDATVSEAGIDAPTVGCSASADNGTTLWGEYKIYVRYGDSNGNYSNFSPVYTLTIPANDKADNISYTSVPVSPSSRVTRREIWRNTHGQEVTWYLDAVISNNTGTAASSSKTDDELRERPAMPMLTEDGWPNANRHGKPPENMRLVVNFKDRTWWAGYNPGDTPVFDGSMNKIIFSEAGEPESCGGFDEITGDHLNAIVMQDDGDDITALMPLYNSLYIFKRRHIYRLSTSGDPRREGVQVHLVAERGCLNQRCWVRAEGLAFVLDQQGIYAFDGSGVKPVSGPIQDYWLNRTGSDLRLWWGAADDFHAIHSAEDETVRFFVAMANESGYDHRYPRYALCYRYRLDRWDVEKYEHAIAASCRARVSGGNDRVLIGTDVGVGVLGDGTVDGPIEGLSYGPADETPAPYATSTLDGTVASATATTLTASDADAMDFSHWLYSPATAKAPVVVVSTDGTVQVNRIYSITDKTITCIYNWSTVPSAGDRWYIGVNSYEAKFGSFRLLDLEGESTRQLLVDFQPQANLPQCNANLYYNQDTSPRVLNVSDGRADDHGVTVTRGSANMQFDLTDDTGRTQFRIDGHGHEAGVPAERCLDVGIAGTWHPLEKTRFYSFSIDGVKPSAENQLER